MSLPMASSIGATRLRFLLIHRRRLKPLTYASCTDVDTARQHTRVRAAPCACSHHHVHCCCAARTRTQESSAANSYLDLTENPVIPAERRCLAAHAAVDYHHSTLRKELILL